jgi:hypothetical protein
MRISALFQKKPSTETAPERLNAHAECRGIWAALPKAPDWMKDAPCVMPAKEEVPPEYVEDIAGWYFEWVFKKAFEQSEALVWLPVMLADSRMSAEQAGNAWRSAVNACDIKQSPPWPDCRVLPGTGYVADRVIALLENNPGWPAVLVAGAEASPAGGLEDAAAEYAAAVILVARPGLCVPEGVVAASFGGPVDSRFLPFWDREDRNSVAWHQWGNVPPPLVPDFLACCLPVATLHRSVFAEETEPGKFRALQKQVHDALLRVFSRDIQPAVSGNPPDIGWLVHGGGSSARFIALSRALSDIGCEVCPVTEGSNIREECSSGDMAHSVLMLAGALARAVQVNKPALVAGFNEDVGIYVGLVRPHTAA